MKSWWRQWQKNEEKVTQDWENHKIWRKMRLGSETIMRQETKRWRKNERGLKNADIWRKTKQHMTKENKLMKE
jgi:hypothetical protein